MLARYRDLGYGEKQLLSIIHDDRSRRKERFAARLRLMDILLDQPIDGGDSAEVRKLYRRWNGNNFEGLVTILINPEDSPERREAARQQLKLGWGHQVLDMLIAYDEHNRLPGHVDFY